MRERGRERARARVKDAKEERKSKLIKTIFSHFCSEYETKFRE